MENPEDYSGLYNRTTKKTQIRLDTEEEVQEKLAAYGSGTHYAQRLVRSIRFSEQTQVEKD